MRNVRLVTERNALARLVEDARISLHALVHADLSDRAYIAYAVGKFEDESPRRLVVSSVLPDGRSEWDVDVEDSSGIEGTGGDGVGEATVRGGGSCCMALDANGDTLSVGLSSGRLLSLGPLGEGGVGGGGPRFEELGYVEGGVVGLSYSPDGELVCVITGLGQIIVMTSSWEPLMEACVVSGACDCPQPTAAVEEEVGAVLAFETSDPSCSPRSPRSSSSSKAYFESHGRLQKHDVDVSWRGDGRYLATCVRISPAHPARLRVWDVESLSLHAIGEQSPGTLPVVAWQPNGRTVCVANYLSEAQVEEMEVLRVTERVGGQGQAAVVRHVGAWKRELRRRREARREEEKGRGEGDGKGRHPGRVFVYERNGLQHGEFLVPGDEVRVEDMVWGSDSRLLAIVADIGTTETRETRDSGGVANVTGSVTRRRVQVWCRSNWKWYPKWTRTFGEGEDVRVAWGECGELVMVVSDSERVVVSRCRLAWDYDVSAYGTVGVIDGNSVLITPMRRCAVPPPLCAVKLVCGRPIACMLFSRVADGRERVGALLDDGRLEVATCLETDDWEGLLGSTDCDAGGEDTGDDGDEDDAVGSNRISSSVVLGGAGQRSGHQFRHAAFLGTGQVVFVGQSTDGLDSLFHYSFDEESCLGGHGHEGELRFENCVELEAHVSRLVRFGDGDEIHDGVLFEFEDGRCCVYLADGTIQSVDGFGTRCDVVRVVPSTFMPKMSIQTPAVLGLDVTTGRLYRNGAIVATDATSVGVHTRSAGGPHLLFTTRSNVLKTLPLFGDETYAVNRTVEDGCLLVSLPEGSVDVIMQAPRGNLEIIRPRALVLPAIEDALDRREFAAAWQAAIVNRVDLNVLVNHGWPSIVEKGSVRGFLEAVGSDSDVAGFLQSLKTVRNDEGGADNKVHHVCEAFRNEVSQDRAWLRTELTSYIKCGDMGKALMRIKEVKEMDMNNMNNMDTMKGRENTLSQPTAETGLKHVLLHNSENAVYEAALGEYELQLAYMVVAHIQRDPGEYLAQLQAFAVIEDQYLRRAAIDKHIGRFDKAIENLLQAGNFDDALDLAVSKDLLKHLLNLVDADRDLQNRQDREHHEHHKHLQNCGDGRRSAVLNALGEQLSAKGKYEDAAITFVAAGDLEQALRSYRLASAWRPAMTLAFRLGKDDSFVKDLARRLSDDLEEFQPLEAARINLDYLNNLPAAIRLFAQGGEWREALRLATLRREDTNSNAVNANSTDSTDKYMEILVSVASSSAASLLKGFLEDADRVDKYWERLRDLRNKRVAMEVLEIERDAATAAAMDDDAFVDTASMATDMSMFSMLTDATAATGASTSTFASLASTVGGRRKNRQKKPKKKNKIRRGSPEEEDQLAKHLLTLFPKANVCEQTGQLAEFLVYVDHEDDAEKLQSSLKALIDKATAAAEDVVAQPPPGRKMTLPYRVREDIFNEAGPAVLLKVDRHIASVAEADLQVQVEEGKTAMSSTGWKWELLRK